MGERFNVSVDEKKGEAGRPAPSANEAQGAFESLPGCRKVDQKPDDEQAHRFEIVGPQDSDLRPEIFRMVVQKGWTLLELRRDAQSLDSVFRELTRGDERLDRGAREYGLKKMRKFITNILKN